MRCLFNQSVATEMMNSDWDYDVLYLCWLVELRYASGNYRLYAGGQESSTQAAQDGSV